jgi:hypothetical protein
MSIIMILLARCGYVRLAKVVPSIHVSWTWASSRDEFAKVNALPATQISYQIQLGHIRLCTTVMQIQLATYEREFLCRCDPTAIPSQPRHDQNDELCWYLCTTIGTTVRL